MGGVAFLCSGRGVVCAQRAQGQRGVVSVWESLAVLRAVIRPIDRLGTIDGPTGGQAIAHPSSHTTYPTSLPTNAIRHAHRCQTHSDEERAHALKIFNHLADRRIEDDEKGEEGGLGGSGLASKRAKGEGGGYGEPDEVGGERQRRRKPAEEELESEEPPQVGKCPGCVDVCLSV